MERPPEKLIYIKKDRNVCMIGKTDNRTKETEEGERGKSQPR